MQKIASFMVDHELLEPGIYCSRKDWQGEVCVTTFDIRMTKPNAEPALDTAAIHALEHLGATFLRNHPEWSERVVYFGPMGCRTGFYLAVFGDYQARDIVELMREMFSWAAAYEGPMPGARAKDCGNYLDLNLPMARWEAKRYLERTLSNIDDAHLTYPNAPTGV